MLSCKQAWPLVTITNESTHQKNYETVAEPFVVHFETFVFAAVCHNPSIFFFFGKFVVSCNICIYIYVCVCDYTPLLFYSGSLNL